MLDSHCHLNDRQYKNVDEVVNNFLSAGVSLAICVGCDHYSNMRACEIAHEYDCVYYTVGIHPDECDGYNHDEIESYLAVNDARLVAVGEIGLDYFHNKENKQQQREVFISQIELAKRYRKPIVIHCRDAYGDMLEILKKYAPFEHGAVMHCYSGSLEFAQEVIKLGVKLSFTGTVTYKNAVNLHEVVRRIPLDSFFVETDSPYLTPVPHRGKMNEPKYVKHVVAKIAELRGMDVSEVESLTDKNAKLFFGI